MKSSFSNNLKELRKANKVSQSKLAEHLNITLKTISHWETGYSEPSIQQVLDIAEFFGVSCDELLK